MGTNAQLLLSAGITAGVIAATVGQVSMVMGRTVSQKVGNVFNIPFSILFQFTTFIRIFYKKKKQNY